MTTGDYSQRILRAVIFDLYGTLVDDGDVPGLRRRVCIVAIAEALGVRADEFERLWDAHLDARMNGFHPTFEQLVTSLCGELGIAPSPSQVAEARRLRMEQIRGLLAPKVGCVEALGMIRGMGYKLGLISDCSWETVSLWPETPFLPLFDVTVFSCVIGLMKPDPQVYTLACRTLEVAPERCLYVGNGGSDELAGAERIGMKVLRIQAPYEVPPDHARPWVGPKVSTLCQVIEWLT